MFKSAKRRNNIDLLFLFKNKRTEASVSRIPHFLFSTALLCPCRRHSPRPKPPNPPFPRRRSGQPVTAVVLLILSLSPSFTAASWSSCFSVHHSCSSANSIKLQRIRDFRVQSSISLFVWLLPGKMAPRWKGKNERAKNDSEAEAHKEPTSKIISQLQASLVQSDATGFLSGNSVRVAVRPEQTDLFVKACFGQPVSTVEQDKKWFQLGLESAFFLCYALKCLQINGSDTSPQDDEELWNYMKSKKKAFPCFYKGYSHLRLKDWVVRPGAQYGVDFVVYRHHPALVHSEYGVLVLSGEDNNDCNGRLREWSDFHCTTRLLGSVAKSLLVLYISKNDIGDDSPSCLAKYTVEERTITRWSPQRCREG